MFDAFLASALAGLSVGELVPVLFVGGALARDESSANQARIDPWSVDVISGAAALGEVADDLRRLAERADAAPFQSAAWTLAAARYHESIGETVHVALVRGQGGLQAALAVAVARRAGLRVARFLGDPVAQYGDALAKRGSPAAKRALDALKNAQIADVFHLRRVRADSALNPSLSAEAGRVGERREAPYAALSRFETIDQMLTRIGGAKQRRERARSRRRLEEQGEVKLETLRGAAAIGALREAIAVKREWLRRRGLASVVLDDPTGVAMLEAVAARDDGEGLVAMRLTVGDAPAAYEIGLLRGRRYLAYLGCVVEAFAGASPGKVQMEMSLEWCRANGVEIYDLLSPNDDYKRQWSSGAVSVQDFAVPVTAAGRAYSAVWLSRLRPRLVDLVRRAPAPLRGAAMRAAVAPRG